jgi:hypothetical protein
MGEVRNAYNIEVGKPQRKRHSFNLDIDRKKIL